MSREGEHEKEGSLSQQREGLIPALDDVSFERIEGLFGGLAGGDQKDVASDESYTLASATVASDEVELMLEAQLGVAHKEAASTEINLLRAAAGSNIYNYSIDIEWQLFSGEIVGLVYSLDSAKKRLLKEFRKQPDVPVEMEATLIRMEAEIYDYQATCKHLDVRPFVTKKQGLSETIQAQLAALELAEEALQNRKEQYELENQRSISVSDSHDEIAFSSLTPDEAELATVMHYIALRERKIQVIEAQEAYETQLQEFTRATAVYASQQDDTVLESVANGWLQAEEKLRERIEEKAQLDYEIGQLRGEGVVIETYASKDNGIADGLISILQGLARKHPS